MPHLFLYEVGCIGCFLHSIRKNTPQNVHYTDSSIFLVLFFFYLYYCSIHLYLLKFCSTPPLSSFLFHFQSADKFSPPLSLISLMLSHIISRLHFRIAFFSHQDLTHRSVPFRKHWTKFYLQVFLKNVLEWKSRL